MTTKQTITDILNKMIGEDKSSAWGKENTYEQALADLREKVPEVVGEILKELNDLGYHRDCQIICKKLTN